jgi:hypothetical protein
MHHFVVDSFAALGAGLQKLDVTCLHMLAAELQAMKQGLAAGLETVQTIFNTDLHVSRQDGRH